MSETDTHPERINLGRLAKYTIWLTQDSCEKNCDGDGEVYRTMRMQIEIPDPDETLINQLRSEIQNNHVPELTCIIDAKHPKQDLILDHYEFEYHLIYLHVTTILNTIQ